MRRLLLALALLAFAVPVMAQDDGDTDLQWVDPPVECNLGSMVVNIRCIETPPTTCVSTISVPPGFMLCDWPNPTIGVAQWWTLYPYDTNGNRILDAACQPTEAMMDDWLVP